MFFAKTIFKEGNLRQAAKLQIQILLVTSHCAWAWPSCLQFRFSAEGTCVNTSLDTINSSGVLEYFPMVLYDSTVLLPIDVSWAATTDFTCLVAT